MTKTAIFAGTFDPITKGHLDIIERALKIFDRIIVAVGENPSKKCLFSIGERLDMIKQSTKGLNVTVDHFSGLLVKYAKEKKAKAIIRGLRAVSDFDYEFQSALMNRKLCKDIETIFIMTRGMYSYLSASIVKESARFGANLKGTVPKIVEQKLKQKFKKRS